MDLGKWKYALCMEWKQMRSYAMHARESNLGRRSYACEGGNLERGIYAATNLVRGSFV